MGSGAVSVVGTSFRSRVEGGAGRTIREASFLPGYGSAD